MVINSHSSIHQTEVLEECRLYRKYDREAILLHGRRPSWSEDLYRMKHLSQHRGWKTALGCTMHRGPLLPLFVRSCTTIPSYIYSYLLLSTREALVDTYLFL
jgi:hypothetical protein